MIGCMSAIGTPRMREKPGLRRLDQEQRLVAGLRGHRDREHALVDVLLDLLAARAQADLDAAALR